MCSDIDWAWDELALRLRTAGIVTPILDATVKNYAIILNALLAASYVENETHTSVTPNTTAWGQKLEQLYTDKLNWFLNNASLPSIHTSTTGTVTQVTNDDRPMVHLHDAMYSTLAELYDASLYGTKQRDAFFRVDKIF